MTGDLMEQVVYHLHLVDSKKKHVGVPAFIKSELKEFIRGVLKTLIRGLLPSTFFKVTITLISHVDKNVRKKVTELTFYVTTGVVANKLTYMIILHT